MGPSNCLQVLHVEVSDQNAIICFLPRHVTLLDWTRKVWQTTPEDEAALLQRGDHEMWCLGCFSLLFPEFWTCNMLQHHDVGLWMGWYARSSQICYFLERLLSQKGLAFVRRGSERRIQLQLFNPPLLPTIAVMKHLGAIFCPRLSKQDCKCTKTRIQETVNPFQSSIHRSQCRLPLRVWMVGPSWSFDACCCVSSQS